MKNYIDITKIKIKGKGNKAFAELYYQEHTFDSEDKERVDSHDFTGGGIPHEDFTNALAALRKHVIEICELGPSTKPKSIEVSGITLSGLYIDDVSVVVITAQKRLKNNKVFPINTPLTTLFDEEKYALAEDLDKKCAAIRREAIAYLEGTKFAPPTQMDLFKQQTEEIVTNVTVGEDGILAVEEKK